MGNSNCVVAPLHPEQEEIQFPFFAKDKGKPERFHN